MSTKTTFKRIALVTVAALGFGTMAGISPASAAATAIKVSNVTVYGYVGETMSAKINLTFTGTTLSTSDSVTISIKDSSKPANAVAIDTTTSTSSLAQLDAGKAILIESGTATSTTIDADTLTASSMTVKAGSTTETEVAYNTGQYNVRFVSPGTYTFAVTVDSATSTLATAPATYTGATLTYVVLSAGAATGDGGVATPFNTAGGVAGAGNYNQVKVTGQKGTTALGTRVVVTGSTFEGLGTVGGLSTIDTAKTVVTIPGQTSSDATQGLLNVLTPTVGTVTISTFLETAIGSYSATASNTVTITVRATGQSQVYSYNEAYMATGNATPTATTDAAAVLTVPKADAAVVASPAPTATIQVDQYDVLEAALETAKTKAVTVEISGAGRVSKSATAVGSAAIVVVAAASANSQVFYVHPDGRSGTGTVVVKVDGVEALKRTVSFTGVATQLKLVAPTAAAPNPSKSYLAVGGTMTIAVLPYDANNIKMDAVAVTATSETATVATVVAGPTTGSVTVTGVAVGKTNITIKNGTLGTLVVPVEVTAKTGVAVLTLDKTSAQPGEKVTWTITATDAKGRPVADGTSVALFSSITSNMSVTGLPTGSETLTGGVSTGSFFAPTSGSGTLQITATHGTAHDTYIAGLKAATAAGTTYTALKDVVELAIVNSAVDAATAAAELAEAAAQDATDAALDATEAATLAGALAQEAVDAVAELSAQVATLIAALKKQITALTKLVRSKLK